MARTKQTARKSTGGKAPRKPLASGRHSQRSHDYDDSDIEEEMDEESKQEIDDKLTEEEKVRRKELEQAPMRAELKHLEKRWTKKHRAYITEPQEDEEVPEQSFNWYEKFALCVTRQYDPQNKFVVRTSLQVNSPSLKDVLRTAIGDFPGISFYTSEISIDFPPRVLYHYRSELEHELDKDDEDDPLEKMVHLPLLLDFIDEEFEDTIKEADNLLAKQLINYEILWTIFRPGTQVFTIKQGQPRVYKLNSYNYVCGMCESLNLSVQFVNYDGNNFGTQYETLSIPKFSGTISISDLNVMPLNMHPQADRMVNMVTQRGRRWEALAGQNFCEYKGVAIAPGCPPQRYNIEGRVMIDCATFHRIEANCAFTVAAFPKSESAKRKQALGPNEMDLVPAEKQELMPLTNEQCLYASPIVRGFSFTEKTFLEFFVDKISPINWNTSCFEQLVLPDTQKELVQALVSEHTDRAKDPKRAAFDDIVKGKGRGLILVLHGPPGVGKTLTAECVAEYSKNPLYIVSSGDLGTNASTLDSRLSRILDLASTWKAVLLIDEADVFLERRALNDMERNSLVSIFLRTLEYYSGILFMTTNRVRTFDDAFKSRIHVPLKYDDLPHSSRVKIWKNFLANVEGGVNIDNEGLNELAEGNLNGRQIKNVVRTAKSLAAYKKRKLDHAQLQQVMEIQMSFEQEMDKTAEDISKVET